MRISNIGYHHSHDADFSINRPEGSGDYLLLLLKTPAIFTFDSLDQIAVPDSFILYSEGTPQNYRAHGSIFTNDWFHFKIEEQDKAFFARLNIPQNVLIPIGDLNELSMLINHLSYETYASNRNKAEIITLYLKLFFIKLSNKINERHHEFANSYYNKMSIIRSKIYNQPFQAWNVDWLSHELTMSRSHFQHLYKDFFGVSPMTDVILSRIEHAKYLLSTTDMTIKKISEMCGYNNDIHFMRQFKQQTGITPSQYREQQRRKLSSPAH